MPETNLSKNDFMLEGSIPLELCDKLIKVHEEIPFLGDDIKAEDRTIIKFPLIKNKGVTAAGYDPEIKASTDVCLSTYLWTAPSAFNEIFHPYAEIASQYHLELSALMRRYSNELWANELSTIDTLVNSQQEWQVRENISIQKYLPGEGFRRWHYEQGCQNKQVAARQLVFMTYLNDVPDGGTEFYFQNKTIKAEKGKTLIWPAGYTHTHRGQISEKHTKYIITGWIHGDFGAIE